MKKYELIPAAAFLALVVLHQPGTSQTTLLEIRDPVSDAGIGYVVETAGDLDGDGVLDVMATAWGSAHPTRAVYQFSGNDGSVIRRLDGANENDHFGSALAGGVDLDGDGTDDTLIGAPGYPKGNATGLVQAISGRDGSVIHTFGGEVKDSWFGIAIDLLEDLDGDGVEEILIGAPYFNPYDPYLEPGRAYVYSGATGALMHRIEAPTGELSFATSIAGVGDLDGDGHEDWVATGTLADALVYSGATGALLAEYHEDVANGPFQAFVADSAQDINLDGTNDVILSGYARRYAGPAQFNVARTLVFSGADGSILYRHEGHTRLAPDLPTHRTHGGADVNGDGYADLLVAGPGGGLPSSSGTVEFLSGRTGLPMYEFRSLDSSDNYGSLNAYGDYNADGFSDVLVSGLSDSLEGFVRIVSGAPLYLQATPRDPVPDWPVYFAMSECGSGDLTLIALTDFDGTPMSITVYGPAAADDQGRRLESAIIPPSLSGFSLQLTGFALHGNVVVASAPETLEIR